MKTGVDLMTILDERRFLERLDRECSTCPFRAIAMRRAKGGTLR